MTQESIEEVAARAEGLLKAITPGAICVAQAWDGRIDCIIRLPDGTVVGEMVPLAEVTDSRIRATGERLSQRVSGRNVRLINELRPPVRIIKLG